MQIGCPHPKYLPADFTSADLSEYITYRRIRPGGESMADWRMAMICATVANFSGNVDAKKKPQGLMVSDFLPKLNPEKKTPKMIQTIMGIIAEANSGGSGD